MRHQHEVGIKGTYSNVGSLLYAADRVCKYTVYASCTEPHV